MARRSLSSARLSEMSVEGQTVNGVFFIVKSITSKNFKKLTKDQLENPLHLIIEGDVNPRINSCFLESCTKRFGERS